MRIFKLVTLSAALAACGSFAAANDIRPGCYERIYSQSHLASHPDQHVAAIRMKVGEWITNVSRDTRLEATFANQGQVRGTGAAGRTMAQFLFCGTEDSWDRCQAECDSGSLQVIKQSNSSMTFRTRYLMVGDAQSCGGYVDLAEIQGQWVSYRLNRVPDANCRGM
ncbi:hypothetical protein TRP8649_04418 [Pelagimonas phthalicica]|uniref:Uncharacterized protein n=1 Tax=Pelagimonas phthalicica TaxID=1037362 RepID=A0A238JIJ8_9RHOB|nr:hypothetical protein [Pelagimonas phthalicica]TDS90107.1 hypothetical protein CLV87_4164 [Pelagimonas phthalicica]SMX30275.1 hypothetical protein TRP8649_04418 [Pelagimonas phthalicica]